MHPRVFIPHIAMTNRNGQSMPQLDFSQAQQFGQLTPVLDSEDDPMFISRLTHKVQKSLATFNATDYLLCVGDPSMIALCAGIVMRRQMSLNLLKWDRQMKTYIRVEVKL